MKDERDSDFALPEGGPEAGSPEAPPAPLVVIQYRRPSLLVRLVPVALILAAVLIVTDYQRRKPPRLAQQAQARRNAPSESPPAPVEEVASSDAVADPAVEAEATQTDAATPAEPTGGPSPEPPPAPASTAVAPRPAPTSPFEIDPSVGLLPIEVPESPVTPDIPTPVEPLTAPVVVEATPPPEPQRREGPPAPEEAPPVVAEDATPAEIVADIRREAKEKEAEQQEIARLKPQADEALLAESLNKIHAARAPFRAELKEIVGHFKERAGPEIEQLCQRYGRDAPAEAQELYHRGIRLLSPRISRRDEVEFMRACGLPETMILDFLAHKLHQTMNTRGGPRDAHEVRIRAARMLLALPPGGAPVQPAAGAAERAARPLTSAVSPFSVPVPAR